LPSVDSIGVKVAKLKTSAQRCRQEVLVEFECTTFGSTGDVLSRLPGLNDRYTVELTTLETRRLKADMAEVFKILRGFKGIDEVKKSKKGWDVQEGMIGNCLKNVLI